MMRGTIEDRFDIALLPQRADELLAAGGRMQMAYAWFPEPGVPELCYLVARAQKADFQLWRCRPVSGAAPSLAAKIPLIGWYERETQDLYGIEFDHLPEAHPLVVEGWSGDTPLAVERPGPVATLRTPSRMPDVLGDEVQLLPFGPVRADVLESAQLLFFYLGEAILRYQPRLFFKHRGLESAFVGESPSRGSIVAERVSGVGSVAHAWAYCRAVEHAAECVPPWRAQALRLVLAELERLYNHLHYFGHLADTTTLKVGQAEGRLLEERVKQLAARLCGHRFMRHLLVPGGLRRDLAVPPDFPPALRRLRDETDRYLAWLDRTSSYLDRLITTGVLSRQVAFDQGATGPVERASGLDRDLRRDHGYEAYLRYVPDVPFSEEGDAYARAKVRAAELRASFDLIERALGELESGPVQAPCRPAPLSEGLGWTESPRGSLFYAVHMDDTGRLARVKIKSPSFSNWRVFPFTVHRTNMMDYAINEASFGLTIAGCDR
jgi:Ni,Fe-hydrogenase III large subunit